LDREDFKDLAILMLSKMKNLLLNNVDYLTNWACLATQMTSPTAEIAIVGKDAHEFRKEIDLKFYSNKVLSGTLTKSDLPLLENRTSKENETQIFVCYNKTCQLPVKSVEEAFGQM
jgi:uncharacterized protein